MTYISWSSDFALDGIRYGGIILWIPVFVQSDTIYDLILFARPRSAVGRTPDW